MNAPIAHEPIALGPRLCALPSTLPVPGLGCLPVNSYLLQSATPVLVDTGLPSLACETLSMLENLIDLEELGYVVVTHADADHVGALESILGRAPKAKVVTSYLGMGKLSMRSSIAPDRFHLINPGQSLDIGDGVLLASTPPAYDAPETMAFFEPRARALFSSDCFGALLDSPALDAREIPPGALSEGLGLWTTVDAPWLGDTDTRAFEARLASIRALGAESVLGAHLPPAHGMTERLLTDLAAARGRKPFLGPDQRALMAMLSAA